MNRTMAMLLVACFSIVVTGCSKSASSCSDKDTIKLVRKIVDEKMISVYGLEKAKLLIYDITAIRTQNTNEQTGAHECAAQFEFMSAETGKATKAPITYTVEKTDKRGEIYVEVSGL